MVFVGGGLTVPGLLAACVERLPAGGRLVANAVTAESEALLVEWHSRLGGELRRFQHYHGEPLGGFTGWRPAMPTVFDGLRALGHALPGHALPGHTA